MLLCFPGEPTDRFLFWLREPPMATAEMLRWIGSGCFVTETLRDPLRPHQASPLLLLHTPRLNMGTPTLQHCAVAHHTLVHTPM